MLDKWAFGMSKIEGDEAKGDKGITMKRGPMSDLAAEVGNVTLDTRIVEPELVLQDRVVRHYYRSWHRKM